MAAPRGPLKRMRFSEDIKALLPEVLRHFLDMIEVPSFLDCHKTQLCISRCSRDAAPRHISRVGKCIVAVFILEQIDEHGGPPDIACSPNRLGRRRGAGTCYLCTFTDHRVLFCDL